MGKNGDPQIGWIGGGSLRQTGCSFQVLKLTNSNNCPQIRVLCQMWACLK